LLLDPLFVSESDNNISTPVPETATHTAADKLSLFKCANVSVADTNAVRILTAEAEASSGLLTIDTIPHLILNAE